MDQDKSELVTEIVLPPDSENDMQTDKQASTNLH